MAARDTWKAQQVSDYLYGYNKYCECHGDDPPETRVTVENNVVVEVVHKHENSDRLVPAAPRNLYLYWTVDDLFALIETALQRDAVVRAQYDDVLGYPTRVYIDYVENIVGDEIDVRLTRYEAP